KANFRIGFVGIARPSFGKENSYVKVISDLTHDMEGLSSDLFQFITSIEKGDQYIGAALSACAKKISWSDDPKAMKVIFLVGNGLVNTGPENYKKAVELLVQKGIIVNAIYILNKNNAREEHGWEEIGQMCNGKFASIQIKNEYYENLAGFKMDKLWELNKKLNSTYLYYGDKGKERWKMQKLVDESM